MQRDRRCDRVNRWLAGLLVGLLGGLAFGSLYPPAQHSWVLTLLGTGLYALMGLLVVYVVINRHAVDLTQAGVILLVVLLSVRYSCAIADAAPVTLPLLTALASTLLARYRASWLDQQTPAGRRAIVLGAGLLGVLTAYTLLSSTFPVSVDGSGAKPQAGRPARLHACAFEGL